MSSSPRLKRRVIANSDNEIRAYFAEHGERSLLAAYIYFLDLLPLLVFSSALSSLMGSAEGVDRTWSRLTIVGGVLYAALSAAGGGSWLALSQGSFATTASDDTIRALMQLVTAANSVLAIAFAVVALSAGLVILRTDVLQTWLGYLSIVFGVLAGLGPLQLYAENPEDSPFIIFGLVLPVIWVLIMSVVLIRRSDAGSA